MEITNLTNTGSWEMAILVFVILILLFFWFYKFLNVSTEYNINTPSINISLTDDLE